MRDVPEGIRCVRGVRSALNAEFEAKQSGAWRRCRAVRTMDRVRRSIATTLLMATVSGMTSCNSYQTQTFKASRSEFEGPPGMTRLERIVETEAITQSRPDITVWGPILSVATLGLLFPIVPWYDELTLVRKEHDLFLNADGSVREVHETEALLTVEFKPPLTLLAGNDFFLRDQWLLLDGLHRRQQMAWQAFADSDPYRFLPKYASGESGAEVGAADVFRIAWRPLGDDEIRYEYRTDVRGADGSLIKQLNGSYQVEIREDGEVILRNVGI